MLRQWQMQRLRLWRREGRRPGAQGDGVGAGGGGGGGGDGKGVNGPEMGALQVLDPQPHVDQHLLEDLAKSRGV